MTRRCLRYNYQCIGQLEIVRVQRAKLEMKKPKKAQQFGNSNLYEHSKNSNPKTF